MNHAPSRGKIPGWTVVWAVLLAFAFGMDMDEFAGWLKEPVWITWILVSFYLLYLTYRWFAARV